MALIVNRYSGTKAFRFNQWLFRIYRDQQIFAEFYDIEEGQKFLQQLQANDKTNNNTSPN